ncbi:hypothetical protein BHM03_00026958 [Ensete ventricosum]|uniref:Uncharacterized protein n=1 Tax=Ensete ventricosum TaxID=4639 RepID=A0A426Y767_ENSVE|nr:hypothetical protein B296_00031961 [Ensete ventricosum]RZR97712.1 hypothetical protein BHM03_00026958 [Ensete ventricosum]
MRPASLSSMSASNLWHTPIPYLFGGLAVAMILIAAALIILAISHWRSSRDQDSQSPSLPEKPVIVHLDMEPKFVVIMAGDSKPSFIANPFSLVRDATKPSIPPSSLNQEP